MNQFRTSWQFFCPKSSTGRGGVGDASRHSPTHPRNPIPVCPVPTVAPQVAIICISPTGASIHHATRSCVSPRQRPAEFAVASLLPSQGAFLGLPARLCPGPAFSPASRAGQGRAAAHQLPPPRLMCKLLLLLRLLGELLRWTKAGLCCAASARLKTHRAPERVGVTAQADADGAGRGGVAVAVGRRRRRGEGEGAGARSPVLRLLWRLLARQRLGGGGRPLLLPTVHFCLWRAIAQRWWPQQRQGGGGFPWVAAAAAAPPEDPAARAAPRAPLGQGGKGLPRRPSACRAPASWGGASSSCSASLLPGAGCVCAAGLSCCREQDAGQTSGEEDASGGPDPRRLGPGSGSRVKQARCLQDPVMGQQLSDDFSCRKEKLSLQISEDCLYLNIYIPGMAERNRKLPVMVWLHGGGLAVGAASTYDGSALAAFEEVVVVVLQYRLGIPGFLSTGDEAAPGNWGFLDQVAALQWVQENIAHFGGDPGSVTIFGESAGGQSVSFLIMSPLAKGLFHKAISQSGVQPIDSLATQPVIPAKETAALAGCDPSATTAETLHCLREKTEEQILETTLKLGFLTLDINGKETAIFMPVGADGVFLPKNLQQLLTAKEINGVPYMIGVNNQEFGWLLPTMLQFPDFAKGLSRETITYILQHLEPLTNVPPEYVDILVDEYLREAEKPSQLRDRFLDLLGDVTCVVPSVQMARYYRDAGHPVYFYEFQHRPSSHAGLKPDYVQSDHGDEIGFIFGKPFLAGNATEEEKHLSRKVMRYWANFARTGDPNGDGLVTWPAYDLNEQYLEMGLKQKPAQKLRDTHVMFWTEILPQKTAGHKKEHSEL